MADALVTKQSRHDVPTTVGLLTAALERRGVRLFAAIDHGAGARGAGMQLSDELVLIFGIGRPAMKRHEAVGWALLWGFGAAALGVCFFFLVAEPTIA